MIYLINTRGIATEIPTIQEAIRLRGLHGGEIAVGFDPDEPRTIAWNRVLAGEAIGE